MRHSQVILINTTNKYNENHSKHYVTILTNSLISIALILNLFYDHGDFFLRCVSLK